MKCVFARFGEGVVLACAITALLRAQDVILQLYPDCGDDRAQSVPDQAFADET